MKIKKAFRRGFTLIELMIVIVILGILMGTILPRLTGAQSRARDTARIADLTNIAQALEVYYNDNGQYPDADAGNCLASDGASADAIGAYLKGDKIIEPASETLSTAGCVGSYYYMPLARKGVQNAAYVLASDVETWQTANYILTDTVDFPAAVTYDDISDNIGVGEFETIDETAALRTVYVLIP